MSHPETPSDPEVQTAPAPTGTVTFTDEGGGGPTVVAVHGIPGRHRDFRWLAPALHPEIRFVRVNTPGFGGSTRTGYRPQPVDAGVSAVVAVAEHLGLNDITVLGHSVGGMTAVRTAHMHPELVSRIVLLASAGPEAHYRQDIYRPVGMALEHRVGRWVGRPAARRVYAGAGFPKWLTDDERIHAVLDAGVLDFEEHRESLGAVSQPTMVAWAENDPLLADRISRQLAEVAPEGPRLTFPRGGHAIQKTRADEVADAMAGFLGLSVRAR